MAACNGTMGATVVYDEQEVFYDVGVHLQSSERGRNNSSRVGFTIEFHPDQLFRGVHDSISVDRSGGYSGIGGDQDEIVLKHAINHAGGLPGMYDDLVRFIAPLNQHTGPGLLLMAKYGDEFLDTQERIFDEVYGVMKAGGYLVVVTNNVFSEGRLFPLAFDTLRSLAKTWIPKDERVWLHDDKRLLPLGIYNAWVGNRSHQYCLVFRKEQPQYGSQKSKLELTL